MTIDLLAGSAFKGLTGAGRKQDIPQRNLPRGRPRGTSGRVATSDQALIGVTQRTAADPDVLVLGSWLRCRRGRGWWTGCGARWPGRVTSGPWPRRSLPRRLRRRSVLEAGAA